MDEFIPNGNVEFLRLPAGGRDGNRKITEKHFVFRWGKLPQVFVRGKRQHVSRLVLVAVVAVQLLNAVIAADEKRNLVPLARPRRHDQSAEKILEHF